MPSWLADCHLVFRLIFLHLVLKAIQMSDGKIQMSDAKIQPSGALGAGWVVLVIKIAIAKQGQ